MSLILNSFGDLRPFWSCCFFFSTRFILHIADILNGFPVTCHACFNAPSFFCGYSLYNTSQPKGNVCWYFKTRLSSFTKTSIFFGIQQAAFKFSSWKNEKPSCAMTNSHQAWVKNIQIPHIVISSKHQEAYRSFHIQFACFMWLWKICRQSHSHACFGEPRWSLV